LLGAGARGAKPEEAALAAVSAISSWRGRKRNSPSSLDAKEGHTNTQVAEKGCSSSTTNNATPHPPFEEHGSDDLKEEGSIVVRFACIDPAVERHLVQALVQQQWGRQ
jgi:hypothetical protein